LNESLAVMNTLWTICPCTETIFLSSNYLTSTVPSGIASLKGHLRGLYLSDNHFGGSIPEALCELQQLGTFNDFLLCYQHATIYWVFLFWTPHTSCFFHGTEALLLDGNSFEGTVPSCIGDQQRLRQLYVFDNQLTGELPIELTELSWLSKFCQWKVWYDDYQFTHTDPCLSSSCRLLVEAGLGLEGNGFRGSIPLEICSLKDNNENFDLWADCGGSFPELLCSCCSVCCPSLECE